MSEEMNETQTAAEEAQPVIEVKPLSDNAFVAFFQRIWRWWLGTWYGFAEKHEKLAGLIYKIFFFFVFSMSVTVWQYIVMTFLPYAFASLDGEAWGWPNVSLWDGSEPFIILGDNAGLGTWIAYEIAVFTAQCINFPLQRNITYKSKGNPWLQALAYFIGWILVSIGTGAIYGLANVFMTGWGWPAALISLVKTVITGGVSMVVFFFIFLIIFPDQQKTAANAAKKLEKLKAQGADPEKIKEAELNATDLAEKARLDTARKNEISARSTANSKAVAWDSSVKKLEKLKANNGSEEDIKLTEGLIEKQYAEAVEAAKKRDEAIEAQKTAIAEVEAARAARAAA